MPYMFIERGINWIGDRKGTFLLATGLLGWYIIQIAVLNSLGQGTAEWLFYTKQPPNHISPGILVAPISHKLDTLKHISSNVGLLLVVGALAEPYIGRLRLALLVLVAGYVGTGLANSIALLTIAVLELPIFPWMELGASGGILSLWAYAGLRLVPLIRELGNGGFRFTPRGIEQVAATVALATIPIIPIYELVSTGMLNTGHTVGLLIGCGAYWLENLDTFR